MRAATGAEPFRGSRIDHSTFRRIAREVFGVEREVTLTRRFTRDWGYFMTYGWAHTINVNPRHRTIEDACRTLAHELWHAVQCESQEWPSYLAQHKREAGLPHNARQTEVEATASEDLFWRELLPCMTPRKGA